MYYLTEAQLALSVASKTLIGAADRRKCVRLPVRWTVTSYRKMNNPIYAVSGCYDIYPHNQSNVQPHFTQVCGQ